MFGRKLEFSRKRIREILLIIAIASTVVLAILVVILYYDVNELKKFLPSAILDFPEDEWIKVNDAKIYRFGQTISPNDQLTLMMNITNKKSIRLNIEPKLYVDVGGEVLKKREDLGLTQIGINYRGLLPPYYFFAGNEGQNNIKVSLALSYFNGTFIKYENASTNFQVLSTGDKLLSEQNGMILTGIIVSAIGVTSASIINAYQTKITRDERNETRRAWIGDVDSHIILNRLFNRRGEIVTKIQWEHMSPQEKNTFDFTDAEYYIKLKNFGQSPAINARGRNAVFTDEQPDRNDIRSAPFGFSFILMPGDEQLYFFKIPREIIDLVERGSEKVYFISEIEYNSGYSREKKKYGFMAEFTTGNFLKIDSWDERHIEKN